MTTQADITLDVRPALAAGEEPLSLILETAARVPRGGTLALTAPFEPVPLYRVLSERGFGHRTERGEGGDFVVRFTRLDITPAATVAEVYECFPATAPVWARHGVDLCCGGTKTLEFVARAHHVELPALLCELQVAAESGA